MPTNFNDTVPAAPGGHVNVAWQKDGSGNVSANIPAPGTVPNFADNETPAGTVNGSNVTFTLAHTPSPSASLQFFINGVGQVSTTDYTISTATITMTSAPSTGALLKAWYRY